MPTDTPLTGQTIVFTGSLNQISRAQQQDIAEHFGAEVSNTIDEGTAFVVRGTENISERKLEQAASLGVAIIDEDELLKRMAFKPYDPSSSNVSISSQAASPAQISAVENFYNTKLDFEMSHVQANTVLSIRDYVQALARVMRRDGHQVSDDAEIVVAGWVVNEEDLSGYIQAWNERRFDRGNHHGFPRLRRDQAFSRIYEKMSQTILEF